MIKTQAHEVREPESLSLLLKFSCYSATACFIRNFFEFH